jgi:hypothetical protein
MAPRGPYDNEDLYKCLLVLSGACHWRTVMPSCIKLGIKQFDYMIDIIHGVWCHTMQHRLVSDTPVAEL